MLPHLHASFPVFQQARIASLICAVAVAAASADGQVVIWQLARICAIAANAICWQPQALVQLQGGGCIQLNMGRGNGGYLSLHDRAQVGYILSSGSNRWTQAVKSEVIGAWWLAQGRG